MEPVIKKEAGFSSKKKGGSFLNSKEVSELPRSLDFNAPMPVA